MQPGLRVQPAQPDSPALQGQLVAPERPAPRGTQAKMESTALLVTPAQQGLRVALVKPEVPEQPAGREPLEPRGRLVLQEQQVKLELRERRVVLAPLVQQVMRDRTGLTVLPAGLALQEALARQAQQEVREQLGSPAPLAPQDRRVLLD